jgi:hypothetical protein
VIEERDHLETLEIDGRIILKLVSGKYNLKLITSIKSTVKQSRYTQWRRLGGEEI